MAELNVNTLVFKKQHDSDGVGVVNSVDEFGVYVAESMPDMDPDEAKTDGDSQDWPDEDGLDVFDAERTKMKEFEVDIPCLCYGDTPAECRVAYRRLLNYLTGRPYTNRNNTLRSPVGTLQMLYQPWVGYGRKDVRYKSTSDKEFWRDATGYTVYTFTVKMEVCDPHTVIKMESDDLVIDNSVDTSGYDKDTVYYGSSSSAPTELDTTQSSHPADGDTDTVSVTTTASAARKCHWIAIPLDSDYYLSAVTNSNGDSLLGYIQRTTSDGFTICYLLSSSNIADTTTFTLTKRASGADDETWIIETGTTTYPDY